MSVGSHDIKLWLFILWLGKQQRGNLQQMFWKSVFPRIVHEIGLARRLHMVWDRYNPMSVKENPRDKQLSATCDRLCKSSWGLANFFEECLQQIRDFYISIQYAIDRTIAGPKRAVHHKRWLCEAYGWGNSNGAMQPWRGSYLHINPSFTCPLNKVGLIHTGDTDILANHQQIIPANPAVEIWIHFHAGKSKRIINLNSIAANLGEETCKTLALFHALTGSDSTSAFKFKGKRSCWNILTQCTLFQFIQEFAKITDAKYCVSPSLPEAVVNYVWQLYRGWI